MTTTTKWNSVFSELSEQPSNIPSEQNWTVSKLYELSSYKPSTITTNAEQIQIPQNFQNYPHTYLKLWQPLPIEARAASVNLWQLVTHRNCKSWQCSPISCRASSVMFYNNKCCKFWLLFFTLVLLNKSILTCLLVSVNQSNYLMQIIL